MNGSFPPVSASLWERRVLHAFGKKLIIHLDSESTAGEFFSDGKWKDFPPGSVLFMPRNHVHAFRDAGDQPSRMLLANAPGGFDRYFARCAEEFAKPGGAHVQRIIAISAEDGIDFAT